MEEGLDVVDRLVVAVKGATHGALCRADRHCREAAEVVEAAGA